ncbi:hypothetical protein KP509_05G001800 [Ceratopteris richardii]|uniref:N-acetyltransferase domain-containing protein n=1 Tax=Ceratopteris richardii TaxID=49495 RepID=A0A8T2UNE5_CERRI|nr:hypothetical protein KP509_05G001800 [Ceratopteris richardii]
MCMCYLASLPAWHTFSLKLPTHAGVGLMVAAWHGPDGEERRGYLSNVCVAIAMQRNGIGTRLVKYAQVLALKQGISDLYAHVAVDNESATALYKKCGFELEDQERPADARLMARPARLLLWMDLSRLEC